MTVDPNMTIDEAAADMAAMSLAYAKIINDEERLAYRLMLDALVIVYFDIFGQSGFEDAVRRYFRHHPDEFALLAIVREMASVDEAREQQGRRR